LDKSFAINLELPIKHLGIIHIVELAGARGHIIAKLLRCSTKPVSATMYRFDSFWRWAKCTSGGAPGRKLSERIIDKG
jgi:hypothetical protein